MYPVFSRALFLFLIGSKVRAALNSKSTLLLCLHDCAGVVLLIIVLDHHTPNLVSILPVVPFVVVWCGHFDNISKICMQFIEDDDKRAVEWMTGIVVWSCVSDSGELELQRNMVRTRVLAN